MSSTDHSSDTSHPELEALHARVRELEHEVTTQNSVMRQEKMHALQRLASGVAHDFNNVLMLIFGYCDVLMEKIHPDGPLCGYLREIRAAGDHAATLTRLLMMFGAKRVFQPVTMNINAIIKTCEPALRQTLGSRITLKLDLCRERCLANVEPDEIEHALANLARNAVDAMPSGGTFSLQTRIVSITATNGPDSIPTGTYVVIRASDTGHGMSADALKHAFEPFHTTRDDGYHFGLGLFTVYAIATQSEGYANCASTPGKGTEIVIHLPLSESAAPAPAMPRRLSALTGTETILLVEDDQRVRSLLRDILSIRGYTVIDAEDGHEALMKLAPAVERVDLVLTDVVMPGMNGRELGEQALHLNPRLKIIYTSGYTEDECLRRQVIEKHAHFLQKPFMPQKLLEKIREVLDTPAHA
jgi:nitrogen-specific signal transduction histidine kinase